MGSTFCHGKDTACPVPLKSRKRPTDDRVSASAMDSLVSHGQVNSAASVSQLQNRKHNIRKKTQMVLNKVPYIKMRESDR